MNSRAFLKNLPALSIVALAFCVSPVDAADPAPVSVLIVYHSGSGNTEKMAQGVADGAKTVSGRMSFSSESVTWRLTIYCLPMPS
jgi:NAD(P)H dehydrogenase (quinone)